MYSSIVFEQAKAAWHDLLDLKVEVDVWRYSDGLGNPRPKVTIVLVHDKRIVSGCHVFMRGAV